MVIECKFKTEISYYYFWFFVNILRDEAKLFNINYSDKIEKSLKTESLYSIFIDGEKENIASYYESISKKMPLSIGFSFLEVVECSDNSYSKNTIEIQNQKGSINFLTMVELHEMMDINSQNYFDIFKSDRKSVV